MNATSHTPGPYHAEGPDEFGDYNIHHPADRLAVAAVVSNMRPADEIAANVALFVAAPETAAERDSLQAQNAALVEALGQLLAVRSVQTLEEAAREYPYGKEDVAAEISAFNAAREAIAAAKANP